VDDLAGYREVLRATVGHDLLPGASAWLDPLHAALTAAAGPAVLAVRRRGPVPDLAELEGLRDGLLASVRDATGTLTADLAGNVLPLGQYAFDPGPAYSVVERGSGPVCGGCGIGMQTLRYHAVAAWMPGRCVDVCPLCGPSVLRRTDDPPVLLAVRERAAPGGEIRLRLSAPSAGPDRTGQARLFLLSRDGAVLAEARDDLAVSTWDISLPAPPGPPDTYRVAGVVCLDLSVQLLRGRVAVW
jgi:hypothetical protein